LEKGDNFFSISQQGTLVIKNEHMSEVFP
jgi:hypothetical protein